MKQLDAQRGWRLAMVLVIVVVGWRGNAAVATNDTWNDGSSNWNNAANWTNSTNGHTIPAAGDSVDIVFTDGIARTITYDPLVNPTLNLVSIDLTGAGTAASTLSMNGSALTASGLLVGGYNGAAASAGRGALIQTNGHVSLAANTDLVVAYGSGSTATYTLSGGTLTASQSELVGYSGNGTLSQSGGTNTINASSVGSLDIGANGGSNGTYNLSGTGTITATAPEYVGYTGTGNFMQTGGSNSVSGTNIPLILGFTATTSNGTYTLSAGTLNSSGSGEFVGFAAIGAFNQSGGTNTLSGPGQLELGNVSGSSGSYTLSGTGILNAVVEYIGNSGSALFTQSGGTNTANQLTVGLNSSPSAVYNLSGTGVLTAANEVFGVLGSNNQLNQTGGTHTVMGEMDFGINPGSGGTYSISGGTATVAAMYLGGTLGASAGFGVLNVSGAGSLSVNLLDVYNLPGCVVNLSGGTLNVTSMTALPAQLNWTGGKLNVNASVAWDQLSVSNTGRIFGAALTLGNNQNLTVTGNETLGSTDAFSLTLNSGSTHTVTGILMIPSVGTLTQNAGSTLFATTITQAGGTVNGTLQNQGNFVYQSGVFNGRLLNQGTTNFGNAFTAGNGIENDAALSIAAGQIITVNGAGLDNEGNLTLAGGTINGSGPLTNSGSLSGYGVLAGSAGFTNSGELSPTGGVLVISNSGAGSNSGNIDIGSGQQLKLTGGNLANTGAVNLQGGTIAGTATVNNNSAGTISGHGTISTPLVNAGSLVLTGDTLDVTGAFTSSGAIHLTGATATLAGGAITNISAIDGSGTIANDIANSGDIQAIGGTLTLTGTITNTSPGRVLAASGAKVQFTGAVTNTSGDMNMTGGTLEFTHALTNPASGSITGRGTLIVGGTGLTNNGNMAISGGATDVFGDVNNSTGVSTRGITVSGNSAVTFWDDVTNGAGSLFKVASGSAATFFGTYSGDGISGPGNVDYEADVSPGFSPASVVYGGNVVFDSTARLDIQLGGLTAGSQHDKVNVTGQLSLGGILDVTLINNFTPAAGNSFDILDWGVLSGKFSSIVLPTLPSPLEWNTSNLYTTGVVSVVDSNYLPGDINRDHQVTVADVQALLKALADFNTYLSANPDLQNDSQLLSQVVDVNGDGVINNDDIQALITLLANNVASGAGGGSSSATAVPEPTSVALAAIAVAFCGILYRKAPAARHAARSNQSD